MAPPAGLEPATSWLTVMRSTDWAKEEYYIGAWAVINSHAYSRKYSRFVRLDTLGFEAPYFRNLLLKNDTQSFFSVVCQLS